MIDAGSSQSLADPALSSSLTVAVGWIEATLLGTMATAVAIICVAMLGSALFYGRLPVQRGVTIVLGCFMLFGAPVIAARLRTALGGGGNATVSPVEVAAPLPPPLPQPPPPSPAFDPYAGASVSTTH